MCNIHKLRHPVNRYTPWSPFPTDVPIVITRAADVHYRKVFPQGMDATGIIAGFATTN
jgi:hypothetical protein